MKTQFKSTEALVIDFACFFDLTVSPPTEVAGDSVTLTITAPDGSHPSVTPTQDASTKIWSGSIATGSYQQGKWKVRAVSNNANTAPQYLVLQWGDYVENLDAAVSTRASTGDVTSARDSIKGTDSRSNTDVYNWAFQGKLVVDAGGLATFYKPDGVTVLGTAQIKKVDGTNYIPSSGEPCQRIP